MIMTVQRSIRFDHAWPGGDDNDDDDDDDDDDTVDDDDDDDDNVKDLQQLPTRSKLRSILYSEMLFWIRNRKKDVTAVAFDSNLKE